MDEEYRQYRADQAHAYLERIRKLGEDCAGLQQLVDDARERADGVKGIDYSAVRVSSSPTNDAMLKAMDSIKSRIADYVTALAEYEGERHDANRAIMRLDDAMEAKALRMRYLLNRDWKYIQTELGYSTIDGVMKLRRRALCSYWDVMPSNERDRIPSAI